MKNLSCCFFSFTCCNEMCIFTVCPTSFRSDKVPSSKSFSCKSRHVKMTVKDLLIKMKCN